MIDKKINQDIGFSIVKPSKDGSRPGYRRSNYDGSGGGFDGPGSSPGPTGGDNNAPGDGAGPNPEDNHPFNTGPDPVVTELDVKEQYGLGVPVTLNKPLTLSLPPDFTKVGPGSQFAINTQLQNELKDYKPKTVLPGFLNIFKLGTPANINFFNKNSIGGKINPTTGQPFGYGIDGFKDYMEQRSLGNVGAYGGTELSQNAINAGSGGDNGIMDVYNAPNYTDDGDADGDGDVDQDDFIFRYFDKTGETLQAGAGGVEDLMTQIRQRINNIFS